MSPLPIATEAVELFPGVFQWRSYSPHHRVELSANALITDTRGFVFDPIPLCDQGLHEFRLQSNRIENWYIVVTNENHLRDSVAWAEKLDCEIWGTPETAVTLPGIQAIPSDNWFPWRIHPLAGAPRGEALFHFCENRIAILGDAIVNLPERGLEILPDKYCPNAEELKTQLGEICPLGFDQLLTAHGTPVGPQAADLVAGLL
jgi:hypothetical protein